MTKFLIVYVIAGHGITSSGKQMVVLNQFDKSTRFYKMWGIEGIIRSITSMFKNTYVIAFFACCREIYDEDRHSGCYTGTDEEVQEIYRKLEQAEKEPE